jgi:hypothetical protein
MIQVSKTTTSFLLPNLIDQTWWYELSCRIFFLRYVRQALTCISTFPDVTRSFFDRRVLPTIDEHVTIRTVRIFSRISAIVFGFYITPIYQCSLLNQLTDRNNVFISTIRLLLILYILLARVILVEFLLTHFTHRRNVPRDAWISIFGDPLSSAIVFTRFRYHALGQRRLRKRVNYKK